MRYHPLLLFPAVVTGGLIEGEKLHFSFGYERAAWTPLTLTEAIDYYSGKDLESFLRLPAVPPIPHCEAIGLCEPHFVCSPKDKESLFMRHESTTSSPVETWKTLIRELKSQGTNTIFLVGDSLSSQHTVDAAFLTESAGYEFTLHKEHGGELIIQIEKAEEQTNGGENEEKSKPKENDRPYFLVVYISADGRMHALRDDLKQFHVAYRNKILGTLSLTLLYRAHFVLALTDSHMPTHHTVDFPLPPSPTLPRYTLSQR